MASEEEERSPGGEPSESGASDGRPGESRASEEAAPGHAKPRRVTESFRWWLRLQVWLMGAGAVAFIVGAVRETDFVMGLAVGLLVGALVLRFGRRATPGDRSSRRGRGS